MNAPLRKKLANALRSGKYAEQKIVKYKYPVAISRHYKDGTVEEELGDKRRMFLRTADGYTALGVLCDLLDPKGWQLIKPHKFVYRHHEHLSIPGSDLIEKHELDVGFIVALADLSDAGKTFKQIADSIDKGEIQ